MDCGSEMHQQFLKDFIQSLQGGSEDNHSLSESSLNPNAAEFVPSYLKSSEDEDSAPYQDNHQAQKNASSTTTLVREENIGDTLHKSLLDEQSRMQRQLFNLMGNSNYPLSTIHFNLSTDAQGINVQFMMSEETNRPPSDDNLCQSGLRVEIGNHESHPGYTLAAEFLNRMCEVFNGKSQAKEPSICPRCTALPKKHSYTELEIERQIEDIKAFEKMISNDVGTGYQQAFKELCHKLGLTSPEEPLVNSRFAAAAAAADPMPTKKSTNELFTDDHEVSFDGDNNLSDYEWDDFIPEFKTINVCRLTDVIDTDVIREEQEPILLKEDYELNVPPSTPAMFTTTANVSSVFPKLYKKAQMKFKNSARKTIIHKDKESKLQRGRHVSPSRGGTSSNNKKLSEPSYVMGHRSKTLAQDAPPKSEVVKNQISEMATSQNLKDNCKMETRSLAKHQSEQVNGNKHSKAATLPRATDRTGQAQGIKQSQIGAGPRGVAPRMTHASKMRQSEVKRRLSLMRGEDTDVQLNEYLFK